MTSIWPQPGHKTKDRARPTPSRKRTLNMRFALLISLGLSLMSAAAPSRAADGPFAPRIIIDDNAITNYEVEQRVLFLKAVNTVGDLEAMALRDLIDDRLKLRAANCWNWN